jgi:putative endonuclease
MYKIYVLLCNDNSLYTGITKNIKKRMQAHINGNGSKYVFSRLPFKLVYVEQSGDRSTATKREIEIKSWDREKKINSLHINFESDLLDKYCECNLF